MRNPNPKVPTKSDGNIRVVCIQNAVKPAVLSFLFADRPRNAVEAYPNWILRLSDRVARLRSFRRRRGPRHVSAGLHGRDDREMHRHGRPTGGMDTTACGAGVL